MPVPMRTVCRCYMCGKESPQRELASYNRMGSPDLDLRPPEMLRGTMEFWIQECPFCGYVSERISDKTYVTEDWLQSDEYLGADGIEFKSELAKLYYRYYLINVKDRNPKDAFFAVLHAAWLCDDEEDTENAVECRKKAVHEIDSTIAKKGQNNDYVLMKMDVMRRAGMFEELKEYFTSVSFTGDDEILQIISEFQHDRMEARDSSCYTVAYATDYMAKIKAHGPEKNLSMVEQFYSRNCLPDIVQFCTDDVLYYSSGELKASGSEAVKAFLIERQRDLIRGHTDCFGFLATVDESDNPEIPVGTRCVTFCMHEWFMCTGFMTIEENEQGQITKFKFFTSPDVLFKCDSKKAKQLCKVPADLLEMVDFQGFLSGASIMDFERFLKEDDERFVDIMPPMVKYLYAQPWDNLERIMRNIGGYMYAYGMAYAFNREKPGSIDIEFSPEDAFNGKFPEVNPDYSYAIRDGFDTGRDLFKYIIWYLVLRKPSDDEILRQFVESFVLTCKYGIVRARRLFSLLGLADSESEEN